MTISTPRPVRTFVRAATWTMATLILLAPGLSSAADWSGTEHDRDGFRVIENPAEAIDPPMVVDLEEQFRLGGWDGGDDEFFGVVTDMIADDADNLYVLDGQLNEIKIYDASGTYVDTIGREGEGPGEWRNAFGLLWMPNGDIGVVQAAPGRIVTIRPDGSPGKDYSLEPLENGGSRQLEGARLAGENIAVIYKLNHFDRDSGIFTQKTVLGLFDATGVENARLVQAEGTLDFASPKISEIEFDNFGNRWNTSAAGQIFVNPSLGEYEIKVWNPDGSPSRAIQRAYSEHRRTDDEREELLDLYRGLTADSNLPPNTECVVEDTHPCVSWGGVKPRPDGSLWVLNSRGSSNRDAASLGTFDVYDPKGRLVRQVELRGQCDNHDDGVFFVGDRVVVVTQFLSSMVSSRGGGSLDAESDSEPEPMAIICYRSSDLDRAAGIPDMAKRSK